MEKPYDFYQFSYPNRSGGQIKVDVWYTPLEHMLINMLHVDKNSGVSQMYREQIPLDNKSVENNAESIELFVRFLVQESILILGENVFSQEHTFPPMNESVFHVFHHRVGNGHMSCVLSVFDFPDDTWKIIVYYGSYLSSIEFVAQGILFEETLTKSHLRTKEHAIAHLHKRFRSIVFAGLAELDYI